MAKNVSIACQTITWGDEQVDFMDRVVRVASEAGYQALEVGFRRLAGVAYDELKPLLDQYGVSVAATHIGGNLEDLEQAASEQTMIDAVLECIIRYGGKYIMYSGLRYRNEDQLSNDIAMLNRAARKCAEKGIHLLYHNHNWEFEGEPRVMDRLLEMRGHDLGFCPDVGWVAKGGDDPIGFLQAVADSTPLVHFKDFATLQPGVDTVCLGEGVVPLAEVAEWIRSDESHVQWVVAEQDKAEGSADDAVAANGRYLKSLFQSHGTGH